MPYVPLRGNSFLVPSGTTANPNKLHLHVIATEACPAGEHLLLSVSTIQAGIHHDPACMIKAGEHPFITHDSYVVYRRARTTSATLITKCVDGWLYIKKEPVSQALLQRMCAGIMASNFTPFFAQDYYALNP